jgi:UDP-3-O-[3-hydroxymyristoyl] glucosamine N-acyltransferase
VVICDHTIIKDNVTVGPNSVIGHYAFYYKKKPDGFNRMHTCGRTILEDNVEIGALSTIDRGVTGDTIIGKGTKIDNQVHVGHDTVIGENCLFAANVGIAGCVVIKNNVTLWGQVGVVSDVTIHNNVTRFRAIWCGNGFRRRKILLWFTLRRSPSKNERTGCL